MSALTLFVIILLLFSLLQLMPGSPFNDEKLSEAQKVVLYEKYGLDRPVYEQFYHYFTNILKGDLGVSYAIAKDIPITQLLETRLPISLRVGGQSVVLGAVVGLLLGIVAALKRNSIWDSLTTVISVLGVSIPSYVFAMGLAYVFGYQLNWFPFLYNTSQPFVSTILPCLALCVFTTASISRYTRSEMIEVLDSEYILFAQSKVFVAPG